jgi:hypothetical protein
VDAGNGEEVAAEEVGGEEGHAKRWDVWREGESFLCPLTPALSPQAGRGGWRFGGLCFRPYGGNEISGTWILKHPLETAALPFAPDKADVTLKPLCPLGARAVVWEIQCVAQFNPSCASGVHLQVAVDGGLEFGVGHKV